MRKAMMASLALAALAAGCGQKQGANAPARQAGGPAADGGKKYVVGYSQSTLQDPWRKAMDAELDKEIANHPNVTVNKQDAHNDANAQINQVESLDTQGMDALLISPKESGPLTPVVTRVFKKGTPVILLDRATSNDNYSTLVGADNKVIGQKAGEYVARRFPNGAKIIEIAGIPGATATTERASGFRAGIGDTQKYRIVASQPGNYLRGDAINVFQNMLTANADVQVVYAHNDEMALGAVGVLERAGKLGSVAVIGVDGQKEAIQSVADGKMAATYVYPRPGADGLKAALDLLGGKQVPKRLVLDTTEITKENAAQNLDKGF